MLIRATAEYNSRAWFDGGLVQQKSEDFSDDLAHWLEDSGRRRALRLDESPETLLGLIEEFAGAKLRCADDITTYFERLAAFVDDADDLGRIEQRPGLAVARQGVACHQFHHQVTQRVAAG